MSITRVGIGFFNWVFSLDFVLRLHDAPSKLCLWTRARVSAYRVGMMAVM